MRPALLLAACIHDAIDRLYYDDGDQRRERRDLLSDQSSSSIILTPFQITSRFNFLVLSFYYVFRYNICLDTYIANSMCKKKIKTTYTLEHKEYVLIVEKSSPPHRSKL